jgi:hypothetical protein
MAIVQSGFRTEKKKNKKKKKNKHKKRTLESVVSPLAVANHPDYSSIMYLSKNLVGR